MVFGILNANTFYMKTSIMKKDQKNFMKIAYEQFWVPFFGRGLTFFVRWIEGEAPKKKPTYDLRSK